MSQRFIPFLAADSRWFAYRAEIVILTVAVAGLGLVFWRWIMRRLENPPSLKPHYQRLGRVAPDEGCPCQRHGDRQRRYEDCCRPKDVEKLRRDIQEFLWRRWSRRSYGGRKRPRTMAQRLEDFPVPKPTLPDWVSKPQVFDFPIDEARLRSWSPLPSRGRSSVMTDDEPGSHDDLPF